MKKGEDVRDAENAQLFTSTTSASRIHFDRTSSSSKKSPRRSSTDPAFNPHRTTRFSNSATWFNPRFAGGGLISTPRDVQPD